MYRRSIFLPAVSSFLQIYWKFPSPWNEARYMHQSSAFSSFAFHLEHAPAYRITCSGKLWRPLSIHIARVYEIWKKDNHSRKRRERKREKEKLPSRYQLQRSFNVISGNTLLEYICERKRLQEKNSRYFNKILIEPFLQRTTSDNYTTDTFVTIIWKLRFELCVIMCGYVWLCVVVCGCVWLCVIE